MAIRRRGRLFPGFCLSPTLTAAVALVAIHAVVNIPLDVVVVEIVRVPTAVATGALENRVVIRIDMAGRTHSIGVAMVDRELRVLRVIERRVQPVSSVMTVLARRREELRLRGMPRIRGVVVVSLVAADAGRRQVGVIVVDVAVGARAWWNGMGAGQRPAGLRVIELAIRPLDGVVALFAGGREARVRHRTLRVVVVVLVA